MTFLVNFSYQNQTLNPHEISRDFCSLYYTVISTKGFSNILNLFDQYAQCNYNGKETTGMYNILSFFASDGISRLLYDKLLFSTMTINHETLLIQVSGICQGVTFWNTLGYPYVFTETFVLKYVEGRIVVTHYIFKIV